MSDTPDSETSPPEPQPGSPPTQKSLGNMDVNVCPKCGYPNSLSRIRCKNCFAPLPVLKQPGLPAITKRVHIAAGFTGWFLINGFIWFLIKSGVQGDANTFAANETVGCFGGMVSLINWFILLILAVNRKTRWIALGMLSAWTVNLLLSLIRGVVENGLCLAPFYINLYR